MLFRSRGREIRPREQRVIGVGFELWPDEDVAAYRDSWLGRSEKWKDVAALHIELDAVIFDDGLLLGPDRSGLGEHFAAHLAAKQDVYRDMVERIDSSGVADDIFAPLRQTVVARRNESGSVPQLAFDLKNPLARYPKEAAAEALGMQHNIMGDVFRRALRREPFIIHRRSDPSR